MTRGPFPQITGIDPRMDPVEELMHHIDVDLGGIGGDEIFFFRPVHGVFCLADDCTSSESGLVK